MWRRKNQVEFLEVLGQMLAAGYDLNSALATLSVIFPKRAEDILRIDQALGRGVPAYQAFKPFFRKGIINGLQLVMLHGELSLMLMELGGKERAFFKQAQRIKQLLIYPALLFGLVTLIAVLMWVLFIPSLSSTPGAAPIMGITVPAIGVGFGLFLVVGVVSTMWIVRKSKYERMTILRRMPIVGDLVKHLIGYHVALHIGLLLKSGTGLSKIVKTGHSLSRDDFGREVAHKAEEFLNNGGNLCDMVDALDFLPGECQMLLAQGKEETALGRDFLVLANQEFSHFEQRIERLVMLIQPICFIVVGAVVIGLYLMMLMPMYSNIGDLMTW
jgi:competence protein ComGB